MSHLTPELRAAEAIARTAGLHILRESQRELEISTKGKNDLVTNVDRSTERLIIELLGRSFPNDAVLGEESGHSSQGATTSRRWIIDPIDGTINFAHGIPLFCVSIGFAVDGVSQVGVIYDPSRDELFSAARGQGAHLNGSPIEVSDVDRLADAMLVTGFPLESSPTFEATLTQFEILTRQARSIRRLGSAAIDLAYVAAGRLDAFWEYGLKPWDTAAGYLLVNEAGGRVTDLGGDSFSVASPSLLASNRYVHEELLQAIASTL